MLIAIACMSYDRVIGIDGKMPWRQPSDMAHFKATTYGHPVIVGSATYASLQRTGSPERGLSGRTLYVVTEKRQGSLNLQQDDPVFFVTMQQVKRNFVGSNGVAYVAGGGRIYTELLPACDKLSLTVLHTSFIARGEESSNYTQLPDIQSPDSPWQKIAEQPVIGNPADDYDMSILTYVKVTTP